MMALLDFQFLTRLNEQINLEDYATHFHCFLGVAFVIYVLTYITPHTFGSNGDNLQFLIDSLNRLEKKKDRSAYKEMSVEEFRAVAARDKKKWSVCFGHIIDLTNFKHPGGDFMHNFIGRDMTPWVLITHQKSEHALTMLTNRAIGMLKENKTESAQKKSPSNGNTGAPFKSPLLTKVDQEYVDLFFNLNRRGVFSTPHAYTVRDFLEIYIPIIGGFWTMYVLDCLKIGFLMLLAGALQQGFFLHDAGHNEVYACRLKARRIIYWVSLIIWGFDLSYGNYIHDIHHGFVNIIGLDGAVDMPMIHLHPLHKETDKAVFSKYFREKFYLANAFYHGFIGWMVVPYYALTPFIERDLASIKDFMTTGLLAIARASLFFVPQLWWYHMPILGVELLGFFWFAIIGPLNHAHKDMTTEADMFPVNPQEAPKGPFKSFVALQSQTIQNQTSTPFRDTITGHFSLHIEHHLFPMMHRKKLKTHMAQIQAFLAKHELAYDLCGQVEAYVKYNKTLAYPYDETRLMKKEL